MKQSKKNPVMMARFACLLAANLTAFAHEAREQTFAAVKEARLRRNSSGIINEKRRISFSAFNGSFQTQTTDADLLKLADLIARAAPKVSRLWSGYWGREQSFVLLRPKERALLFSRVAPTADNTILNGENIPASLRGRIYAHRNYPPIEANGDPTFRVGNAFAPALEPQKATGLGSAEFQHLNYLYHEWFHAFQRNGLFKPSADEPQASFRQPMVTPDRIADPKFTEAAELERRILITALQTASEKELRRLLQQYLAVRFVRTRSLPDVQSVERHFERYEGTATLVGLQAAMVATDAPAELTSNWIHNHLEKKLDSFPASPTPDSRLMRWRLYSTGAAIG